MKLFPRLFGRKASQFTYDQIADRIDLAAHADVAGVVVTEQTALEVSTVLACVKAIAEGCAAPALDVYRRLNDGTRQRAADTPEARLLGRRPNEWQTSIEWRRMMTMHAALTGGGLSIISRDTSGGVRELLPVTPGKWTIRQTGRYRRVFECRDEYGLIGEFSDDQVFFLPGFQWDKTEIAKPVAIARSAIGLAMATEKSQASMHKNGLRPSGMYSIEGTLTDEQYQRLSGYIAEKSGPYKTGTPLILDRAARWVGTALTGVDTQHIETRRLQVEEICRAFGVYPVIIGHADKTATFASTESFFRAHLIQTLTPWHETWKQRLDEMLLDGAGPLFVDFDTRYMTRGSEKDHAVYVRTMAEMGVMTRNELRQGVGLDPLPGLDDPLTPLNMNAGDDAATGENDE